LCCFGFGPVGGAGEPGVAGMHPVFGGQRVGGFVAAVAAGALVGYQPGEPNGPGSNGSWGRLVSMIQVSPGRWRRCIGS
jgi:hypothetical protein